MNRTRVNVLLPRTPPVLLPLLWLAGLAASAAACPPQSVTIEGKPYVKLATRDATRAAMVGALLGSEVEWGPWQMLGPFDCPGGTKALGDALPAEAILAQCGADGPGPEAARRWPGRRGEVAWRELAGDGFDALDFHALFGVKDDRAAVLLHRTFTAKAATRLRVRLGSDDGLRLWIDGRLELESKAVRPLNVDDHLLEVALAPGRHHLVAKVTQDEGGWGFQMAPAASLSRAAFAALEWQLQLDFPEGEAQHWRIATLAVPESAELEVGGLDVLPDGRPVVCTRRGDVFVVDGGAALPPTAPRLTLFASGLQEPLGVALRKDARAKSGLAVWVAQRGELTRLVDVDGDLSADLYETVCDGWQISGNYHEYAFGPRFDPDGNAWVTLNLGHTDGPTVMGAPVPTRGCAVRVAPDGTFAIAADGLRSPDALNWLPGVGMAYTDNQGDYVATGKLSPMPFGSFHGHQASLVHRPGRKPGDPVPAITPAAVWFPYSKMGQSTSDFIVDTTGGRFGPFANQLFVGDQTHSTVMRVTLEPVSGEGGDGPAWQGACYPFRAGFRSGVHRLAFAPDGALWVGGTDRGWGARGGWNDALERVLFTGVAPFEMAEVKIAPDGFDVAFTQPVDPASASAVASWRIASFTYEYHPAYGSAELQTAEQRIVAARIVDDRTIHLVVDRLRANFVHELHVDGVRSRAGAAPLHDVAYYTVNRIPASR